MPGVSYRGFTLMKHGRQWRCQMRPRPIVRETLEEVKAEIDRRLAERTADDELRHVRDRGGIPIGELCAPVRVNR